MNKTTIYKLLATVVLMVAAWLFWWQGYACALCYHEQLQLFQTSGDYLVERLSVPGGLADYMAEFLVQFYFVPAIGALFIALIYAIIQWLSWLLMRQLGASNSLCPLSFIPSVALWAYMGNENVMFAYIVAIMAVLAVALLWTKITGKQSRAIAMVIIIPIAYWLFGSCVFSLALFAAIYEIVESRRYWAAGLYALLSIASVLVSGQMVEYPIDRLFIGLNYFRYPDILPYVQVAIMVLVAVLPLVGKIDTSRLEGNMQKVIIATESLAVALATWGLIKISFDETKYELIDYDYLVRTAHWDKIIEKAKKKQPSLPMSVASLNLALYETGQLPDRMFEFFQNGGEGLFPAFSRDFTSPLSTAEIYFRLGMVNTAQRYMFEAEEAIPNYTKSARMTKRLAETNLINGQYKVAAKYIRMLKQTLFYKSWAEETSTYLYNEKKIDSHPLWGKLRKYRYTEDFLFSDAEMDQMLGLLFLHCKENRMAYEYLMAYVMLQRDMRKFMAYYPLGKDLGYNHIPRSYQEALLFSWTQTHRSFNGLPYSILPEVMQAVNTFGSIYQRNPNDPMLKVEPLKSSYWNYLLVKSEK